MSKYFNKITIGFKALLFIAITYFTLFNHLDRQVIRHWDESRIAINSYEMNKTGYSIVTTFNYEPDMWNVKPPLVVWMQTTFMKVLGTTELAVRLPAAIGAFLTCCLLLFLGIKYFQSYWFGLLSVIVLVSSRGFVEIHAARSGEFDGMLTFFTTFYTLCFFLYLELKDDQKKRRFLNLTFVGLTLAVLTKGVAGLLLTPGILLYMVIRKQLIPTLKLKQSYINLAVFFGIIASYYLLREQYNPGYLATVWEEEWAGRYNKVDTNTDVFWYYKRFLSINFVNWYPLLVIGAVVGLFWKKDLLRNLVSYCLIVSCLFLIIISNAGTKLYWYDMPMYPLLSIVAAVALYWLLDALRKSELRFAVFTQKILPYALVLAICVSPYRQILNEVCYLPDVNDDPKYHLTYYLRDIFNGKREVDNHIYLSEHYFAFEQFYLRKLIDEKKAPISVKNFRNLAVNDKVITDEENIKTYISTHYETDTLEMDQTIMVYKIKSIKENMN